MAFVITSAIAVDYAQGAETFDIELDNGAGADTTHTVTLAAGTRRVLLAASSADILQVLDAALNAPAPGLPGGTSFLVSMDGGGKVSITCAGNAFRSPPGGGGTAFHSTQVGKVLGFTAALTPYAASFTATLQPRYIIYSCSLTGLVPQPVRTGGWESTAAGRVYGFGTTQPAWKCTAQLNWHPKDPTTAAAVGCPATPTRPDMQYLASIADTVTARAWSIADVVASASNAQCGICEGLFQTMIGSTVTRFLQGYIGADAMQTLETTRHVDGWPTYERLELPLVLPTTGSSTTRA